MGDTNSHILNSSSYSCKALPIPTTETYTHHHKFQNSRQQQLTMNLEPKHNKGTANGERGRYALDCI